MEQPEEKCGVWRNWCQSVWEFLWDLAGFVVMGFFFPLFAAISSNQTIKSFNASKHDDNQAPELQNLSLGPPPSSQWGNNISWWLSGDLEQLKVVWRPRWKMSQVLPCPSWRRSKPSRSTRKKKKNFSKVYFKMETNASITCEGTPLVGEKSEQPLQVPHFLT